MSIVKKLQLIQQDMKDLADEAKARAHESPNTHNHHLRIFYHLRALELGLAEIAKALQHEIDPHS